MGTANSVQGQTQMLPLIVASEWYSSDVINRPDIQGFLRKDDVVNRSLRAKKLGRSQVEAQCDSGGREAIAGSYVDHPEVSCVRVAGSSSLDLDQPMRWIVPRTTLQGSDALVFSPQPSVFVSGEATSVAGSNDAWPGGTRTAVNMDWLPRFNEQGGPSAPGGVPGPGILREEPVEPIRQLVPVWHVVPFLSVSERYDSNVFFAPKSDLAGLNVRQQDFVTTVNPQLVVSYMGKLVQWRVLGGTITEFYVKNPDLNYTGYNGQLYMDLAQTVQRVLPRARSLIVSDSILYTPQLPAFYQGGPNFVGLGGGALMSDAFGRGIQAFRINTFMNVGSAQGSYALSPTTDFGFDYTNSVIRFGGTFLGVGGRNLVFDSTSQVIHAGPRIHLSTRDVLGLGYVHTEMFQTGVGTYKSHGTSVAWSRTISPSLASTVSGGASAFEGLSSLSTGGTLIKPGSVFPSASLLMTWSEGGLQTGRQFGGPSLQGLVPGSGASRSMVGFGNVPLTGGAFLPAGKSTVALNYSVGVFPSFLLAAGPMLSHTGWFQASHGLTDSLGITGGVNYGHSEAAGQTTKFSFASFSSNLGLNYLITPTLRASITHTFGSYQISFGGRDSEFTRQTGMFNLTYILGDNFLGLGALTPVTRSDYGGVDKK